MSTTTTTTRDRGDRRYGPIEWAQKRFKHWERQVAVVCVCWRYIAIVHPIHAHIICCRRRIMAVLCLIWPLSLLCALPTLIYNTLVSPPRQPPVDVRLCVLVFPARRYGVLTPFPANILPVINLQP